MLERLPRSGERLGILIGAALLAIELAGLVIWTILFPAWGRAAWAGAAAEITAGRESGIAVALEAGLPWWQTWPLLAWQDLAAASLTYPIFLWALHKHRDADNFVMTKLRSWQAAAERHEGWVGQWGPLGIYVFLLVPFLLNGPLIAAVVGRLAGIRTRALIAPVVAGVVIGTGMWVIGFDTLLAASRAVHPFAGTAITVAVVVAFVLGGVIADRWQARRQGTP